MNIVLMPNSYLPSIGGLEIAVSQLASALAQRGHRVSVITGTSGGECPVDGSAKEIPVFRLPSCVPRIILDAGGRAFAASVGRTLLSPVVGLAALVRFRSLLRDLAPDIVNLHYLGENAAWCYFTRMRGQAKFVVSAHGSDIERHDHRGRLSRHLTRTTLRRADRVLANSRALLSRAIQIEPSVARKSRVIPNGIDALAFEDAARFPHPRRYLLCVGSFAPIKGQDVLLRAFESVRYRHPDVDLLFAGDGRERPRCQKLATELGVDKSVTFLGTVSSEQVPRLLAGCEMLVQPSRKEAFGMALLEAMASGKPVVATRVGGIPELVRGGENGLLVNPEDPHDLSEAICALLEDTDLAKRLGARGRELAKDYSWDAIAQRYIAVYEEAIA